MRRCPRAWRRRSKRRSNRFGKSVGSGMHVSPTQRLKNEMGARAPAKPLAPFFEQRDTRSAMPYTDACTGVHRMKWCSVLLLSAVLIPGLYAVEKLYPTGKIGNIQQKTNSVVFYYQSKTPITKAEPYFEVSVQVKDTIYVGDYTPRHSADTFPEEGNVPQPEARLRRG